MAQANIEESEVQFGDVARVVEITGISKGHLVKLRLYQPEKSPPFFRIGRRVLYPLNGTRGLQTWAAQRMQGAAL